MGGDIEVSILIYFNKFVYLFTEYGDRQ